MSQFSDLYEKIHDACEYYDKKPLKTLMGFGKSGGLFKNNNEESVIALLETLSTLNENLIIDLLHCALSQDFNRSVKKVYALHAEGKRPTFSYNGSAVSHDTIFLPSPKTLSPYEKKVQAQLFFTTLTKIIEETEGSAKQLVSEENFEQHKNHLRPLKIEANRFAKRYTELGFKVPFAINPHKLALRKKAEIAAHPDYVNDGSEMTLKEIDALIDAFFDSFSSLSSLSQNERYAIYCNPSNKIEILKRKKKFTSAKKDKELIQAQIDDISDELSQLKKIKNLRKKFCRIKENLEYYSDDHDAIKQSVRELAAKYRLDRLMTAPIAYTRHDDTRLDTIDSAYLTKYSDYKIITSSKGIERVKTEGTTKPCILLFPIDPSNPFSQWTFEIYVPHEKLHKQLKQKGTLRFDQVPANYGNQIGAASITLTEENKKLIHHHVAETIETRRATKRKKWFGRIFAVGAIFMALGEGIVAGALFTVFPPLAPFIGATGVLCNYYLAKFFTNLVFKEMFAYDHVKARFFLNDKGDKINKKRKASLVFSAFGAFSFAACLGFLSLSSFWTSAALSHFSSVVLVGLVGGGPVGVGIVLGLYGFLILIPTIISMFSLFYSELSEVCRNIGKKSFRQFKRHFFNFKENPISSVSNAIILFALVPVGFALMLLGSFGVFKSSILSVFANLFKLSSSPLTLSSSIILAGLAQIIGAPLTFRTTLTVIKKAVYVAFSPLIFLYNLRKKEFRAKTNPIKAFKRLKSNIYYFAFKVLKTIKQAILTPGSTGLNAAGQMCAYLGPTSLAAETLSLAPSSVVPFEVTSGVTAAVAGGFSAIPNDDAIKGCMKNHENILNNLTTIQDNIKNRLLGRKSVASSPSSSGRNSFFSERVSSSPRSASPSTLRKRYQNRSPWEREASTRMKRRGRNMNAFSDPLTDLDNLGNVVGGIGSIGKALLG
jgi:hypothetical protein